MNNTSNISGALNLLQNCMNVRAGDKVLLVCERPELGWYDAEAGEILSSAIHHIGAELSLIEVGHPDDPLPALYDELIDQNTAVIYLARIGDQDRFVEKLPGKQVAMLYARDGVSLRSEYASIDHGAMKAFKTAIDQIKTGAENIKITCPLGTDIDCQVDAGDYSENGDVAVKRFPLCVPQPVLARGMSGKVALSGWLTPTGSQSYSPAACKIDDIVFVEIEAGRIAGFQGDEACVSKIKKHYEHVANCFGIDRDFVHSWHAGIHPACSYPHKISDDPDRWSNNVFGNPRYLHFHTCGAYPPGEICWMVLDPTILVDGVPLWDNGKIIYENFAQTVAVVDHWPALKDRLNDPYGAIGAA